MKSISTVLCQHSPASAIFSLAQTDSHSILASTISHQINHTSICLLNSLYYLVSGIRLSYLNRLIKSCADHPEYL